MYAAPSIPEEAFAGAAGYRKLLSPDAVHETADRYFPYSERHVQALWYDDSLRPEGLKTSRGEPVIVENAGRWNLEAGPDFLGTVLRIGKEKRRMSGDAEIHIVSNDWKNHGHQNDPKYEGVRFHITWFPGPVDESLFPMGTIHMSLYDICTTDMESIDLKAYPYEEPRASKTFALARRSAEEKHSCLENAGKERLRQKTQRMVWLVEKRGEQQALYEEIAAALGYKNNKLAFHELARRLPLDALARYDADWKTIYSVLLGISGLLPKQPGAKWSAAAKKELRSLWDLWWKEEHRWEDVEHMSRADWNLSGMRPLNHPVRRLCALAQYAVCGSFQTLENCFWSSHIGWSGTPKKAELVGEGRLQAIELNVMLPFRLATGQQNSLENLPAEPINSLIKEAAYTLFGPDHSPKLYRSALARQGLIQIFHDFILTNRLNELK